MRPSGAFNSEKLTEIATKSANAVQTRSRKLNITLLTSHIAVVAVIISTIAVGYRAPVEATGTGGGSQQASATVWDRSGSNVDQIAAANVAASVAQSADMAVQTNVSSLSISLDTKTELAQTDSSFLSKPQIVSQTGRKGVTRYAAKAGDTVQTVAAQFGVSEDTIRWANKLTSDALSGGQTLLVPGTTGVLYTVQAGDDAAKLADKYKADKDRIITFNDAELTGLKVGQQIIIPDGVLPANERPGYQATSSTRSSSSSSVALGSRVGSFSGNGYSYGYCTWYAYNRRAELGRPVGGNWGNAVTWASYARADGYRVDHVAEVGAVLQTGGGIGGLGHVAVVERVNGDGSITVSEMNYAGWNVISNRTISADQVSSYNYIH